MPDGFSKLSVNKLNACFNTLIKSLYKNIDKLSMHLDIFSIIYEDTRQTNQSVINFSTAFKSFCIIQITKTKKTQMYLNSFLAFINFAPSVKLLQYCQ